MAGEPQAGQGALLGIAQKLAAEESRQITTGLNGATSSASLPNRPEALDLYWWGVAQNFVALLLLRHLRVRRLANERALTLLACTNASLSVSRPCWAARCFKRGNSAAGQH